MSIPQGTGPEHSVSLRGEAVEVATKLIDHEKDLGKLGAAAVLALVYVGDQLSDVVRELRSRT